MSRKNRIWQALGKLYPAKEIMDHIGYYNNSKNMTTYVRPLLEMGYLEMTEPDKPKSKNQKYRKVRKE